MDIRDAYEIVRSLAEENVIDDREALQGAELADEQDRQIQALRLLDEYMQMAHLPGRD